MAYCTHFMHLLNMFFSWVLQTYLSKCTITTLPYLLTAPATAGTPETLCKVNTV